VEQTERYGWSKLEGVGGKNERCWVEKNESMGGAN